MTWSWLAGFRFARHSSPMVNFPAVTWSLTVSHLPLSNFILCYLFLSTQYFSSIHSSSSCFSVTECYNLVCDVLEITHLAWHAAVYYSFAVPIHASLLLFCWLLSANELLPSKSNKAHNVCFFNYSFKTPTFISLNQISFCLGLGHFKAPNLLYAITNLPIWWSIRNTNTHLPFRIFACDVFQKWQLKSAVMAIR